MVVLLTGLLERSPWKTAKRISSATSSVHQHLISQRTVNVLVKCTNATAQITTQLYTLGHNPWTLHQTYNTSEDGGEEKPLLQLLQKLL